MASFADNFRQAFGAQSFTKYDPIGERRRREANTEGFEKAIDRGDVRGTEQYSQKERDTVQKMDRLYELLSNEFQDNFYYNHFNKDTGEWDDVSDKQMVKESTDFLNDVIKNRGLNKEEFANGKNFVENFRKYGYNRILLPDIKLNEKYFTGDERFFPRLGNPPILEKEPKATLS